MRARVENIMTAPVIAVVPGTPCREIAAKFRAHKVSGFPVVDGEGKVIGVVSETDLLAAQARDPRLACTAGDLMTSPAVTIGPHRLATQAAHLMHSRNLRRLPVVDHAGRLIGIISRADVLRVFGRPDEEILSEIRQDVIAEGFFTDPDRLTVTVQDGIVTLAGNPGSAILGYNIIDQVNKVEGVVAVRDQFSYPRRTLAPVRSASVLFHS